MIRKYIKSLIIVEVNKEVRKQIKELNIEKVIQKTVSDAMEIVTRGSKSHDVSWLSGKVAMDFRSSLLSTIRDHNTNVFKQHIEDLNTRTDKVRQFEHDLKNKIDEASSSEKFIDMVVEKINKKQIR